MDTPVRILPQVRTLLRCPVCRGPLAADSYDCATASCAARFPVVDGIPILINEQASIFSIADFTPQGVTFFRHMHENRLKKVLRGLMPAISRNVSGRANYRKFAELLQRRSAHSRVLVIGGSILGDGMEALADSPAIELVDSDVSFGPRTALICDAHDLPFADASFDAVVVQAVLQHVVDPYRCIQEAHRVLKDGGLVYAESPFMQQVHGGRYDFTRFTHLGHRRLFRWFDEIESGAVCGPGMALAWSYMYFLLSFVRSKKLRPLVQLFARCTAFPLKYVDRFIIGTPGTLDAASGLYFMGAKASQPLPDRELIKLYRGALQ